MKVADIVVWDIETGGFKKEENGLAEIALIVIDSETLEEKDRYETVIAPYELPSGQMSTYTSGALNVNGLTLKQIEGGKPAKQVAKELKAFCAKHKKTMRGGAGRLIPAGHNLVGFDIPWLEYFLDLFKVKYSDLFNPLVMDTIMWTRLKWVKDGSIANHKLGTACEMAGVQLVDAHRAMNDVEGNAELVRSFLRSLRQQGQVQQVAKTKAREKFKF